MNTIFLYVAAVTASISSLTPAENAISNSEGATSVYFGQKKSAIQEVLDNGEVIILTDGSKWIVYPGDRKYSSGWLGPADVTIEKSGIPQGKYRYAFTNHWTKKTVLVRRWPSGKVI